MHQTDHFRFKLVKISLNHITFTQAAHLKEEFDQPSH